MDILAGLKDKLRFIERYYAGASEPFREIKRKIEVYESPYIPSSDPEDFDGEPPFLSEWIDADESLNLVGQSALNLVQTSLKEFLDGFEWRSPPAEDVKATGGNWFLRRQDLFLKAYNTDWAKSPIPFAALEEINLTRNDSQHQEVPYGMFGLTRRQSADHHKMFPQGLFVHEIDKQMAHEPNDGWLGRIYVTAENLNEAIRRVETFCEWLEANRPY